MKANKKSFKSRSSVKNIHKFLINLLIIFHYDEAKMSEQTIGKDIERYCIKSYTFLKNVIRHGN